LKFDAARADGVALFFVKSRSTAKPALNLPQCCPGTMPYVEMRLRYLVEMALRWLFQANDR
jgi:hypothetical protein